MSVLLSNYQIVLYTLLISASAVSKVHSIFQLKTIDEWEAKSSARRHLLSGPTLSPSLSVYVQIRNNIMYIYLVTSIVISVPPSLLSTQLFQDSRLFLRTRFLLSSLHTHANVSSTTKTKGKKKKKKNRTIKRNVRMTPTRISREKNDYRIIKKTPSTPS